MISYGFFDSKKAENYCRYIGEKFGESEATVPLKEEQILTSLDIRYGERFIYFRYLGSMASFAPELFVLKPVLRIFGNFIIAIKANDSVSISNVGEIYDKILDHFGSSNASDFSLGLLNCFGDEDKIEIEVTAKTFFGQDLTDSFNLHRLWEQILSDSSFGFDQSFLESAKSAGLSFEDGVIVIKLPSVARMMAAMNSGAIDFEKAFAKYTAIPYKVLIE